MKFAKVAVTVAVTITLATTGTVANGTEITDPTADNGSTTTTVTILDEDAQSYPGSPLIKEDQGAAPPQETVEIDGDLEILVDPALALMPEDAVESDAEEDLARTSRAVAEAAAAPFGTQLLSILNAERARAGLPALKLTVAAQNYAQSFTQTWTDRHSTCGTPSLAGCHMDEILGKGSSAYRQAELKRQRWANGGDLLARGYKDEAAVANAWLNSDGHRKWIMNSYGPMTAIGLGKVSISTTTGYVTTTINHWTLWIVGAPLTNPGPDLTLVGAAATPSPTPAPPTTPAVAAAAVERLSGTCRYSTNLALNQKHMKPGHPVFVATGSNFPDALSIGPAVAKEQGSLFLAQKDHITAGALELIAKNKPSDVYIIGGEGAISNAVASKVASAAGKGAAGYRRVAGSDRFDTSVEIFNTFFAGSDPSTVFVATGNNFPDALSAAAAGGAVNAPVLLVNGAGAASLNAPQAGALTKSKVRTVQIVGGTGVVNPTLEKDIRSRRYTTNRLQDTNRYGTNAAVNRYVTSKVGSGVSNLWIATGSNFPDALSAAAPAGSSDALLVLSPGRCIPKDSISGIEGGTSPWVHLVGGTAVLDQAVAALKQC